MSFLDMRTVIFVNVIVDVVCASVVVMLWYQNRHRFLGAGFWAMDYIFQTIGMVLIILRGAIPDWMSMTLANTLVITGAVLGYIGLERFVQRIGTQVHNFILILLFSSVHAYFVYIHPDLAWRNLIIALGLLIVCFQCAWLMMSRIPKSIRSLTKGVGIVFITYCLVSIIRILEVIIGPHPDNDFFRSGTYDTLIILAYQMLLILLAYALILMVNRRLMMEVQLQEEKFTKAFHSSPYAITLTRLSDGTIFEANGGFLDITGYLYEEVVGKTTLDLHLWEKDEDRANVVNQLAQSKLVEGLELRFRKKSGELLTGLFSAEIITIHDQPCVLSSVNDITKRIQAEQALKSSEEKYRRIVELANEGIWMVDQESKTSFANRRMADMLGYSTDEMNGRSLFDFMDDEGRRLAEEDVERRKQGVSEQHDFKFKRKDGQDLWALLGTCPLMDEEGKYLGALAMVTDITERKRADTSLRAALAEKDVLLREVHHRVKNNIQAIIYLVESRLPQVTDEQTVMMLKGFQEQARTMGLVYEQLYQSESLSEVRMDHYLHDLASNVVEAFGAGKRIELSVECKDVRLDVGSAMPCGLLVNELLTNALKYAFPAAFQGIPRLLVSLEEKNEHFELVVKDNGVGLPDGMDQRTQRSMGLRLVKLWATHQMGGTLEVVVQEGTAYHITFSRKND